jgi:hypothetical protein
MLVVFPVAVSTIAGSGSREQTSIDLRDCTDVEAGHDAEALSFCTEAPEPFGRFWTGRCEGGGSSEGRTLSIWSRGGRGFPT